MNEAWTYATNIVKLSYLAGLIDGEGSIQLDRRNANEHRSPSLTVPSTTYEILEWLQENYGGCISFKKKRQEHYSDSWVWQLRGDKALDLLDDVQIFLNEPFKSKRALLLLKEYKEVTSRNGKYSTKKLKQKKDFEKRFLEIHK